MELVNLYIIAGALVGFIVGLTGVGGGSLMTPLLIFLFGFSPATAVGTDLLFASITKSAGSLVHGLKRNVEWRIVALLGAGSVPAALLTINFLSGKDMDAALQHLITVTLGIALLLTALALLAKDRLLRASWFLRRARAGEAGWTAPVTVLTGAVLGVLVSLTSVGAGALGVVALFFLYPHIDARRLVGTDIVHAVPLTLVGGLGHMHLGTVNYELLASLLVGSLPGIYFGSHMGVRIPERIMRPILASLLAIIGLKFVL